ncbi:carboxypeptidase regulatory-like domain-containing protein [Thiorhodococcus minor]|uniref:carboxypeptidase regulatory-like domain-containing protein n=1 Tax=Thiorhodococcus minor TaxID=57489 RepID=UPI001ADC38F8|nr:carboxypeptidase regulatory-like domain-containing protein [Thiorhodococcus minor]
MRRRKLMLCSTAWIGFSVCGAAPSAGAEEMQPEPRWRDGVRTEWAIAPEGTGAPAGALPEGTVLQDETVLPAGTVLPGGALLPETPVAPASTYAPAPKNAVDVDAATGVPYISGGIGVSGREEMESLKSRFNLRLLFAIKGSGSYLADVKVRIDDAAGPTLLDAVSQGPWFYASLSPGRYILTVDNAGQAQTREVKVPASGALEQSFYWTD